MMLYVIQITFIHNYNKYSITKYQQAHVVVLLDINFILFVRLIGMLSYLQ